MCADPLPTGAKPEPWQSTAAVSAGSSRPAAVHPEQYDATILSHSVRRLYRGTDLFNVGYWRGIDPERHGSLPAACKALVALHLQADPASACVENAIVLDVGCGLGETSETLAEHYAHAQVVGLNYSHRQLRHARKHHPQTPYVTAGATLLPIATESVERIQCVEAALHFDSRWDFLAEAFRVLRTRGRLILTDILFQRASPGVPEANVGVSIDAYLQHCLAAGWRVSESRDITYDTLVPYHKHLVARGLPRLADLMVPQQDGYWLLVLEKP